MLAPYWIEITSQGHKEKQQCLQKRLSATGLTQQYSAKQGLLLRAY